MRGLYTRDLSEDMEKSNSNQGEQHVVGLLRIRQRVKIRAATRPWSLAVSKLL
jgi:hypothetical protein